MHLMHFLVKVYDFLNYNLMTLKLGLNLLFKNWRKDSGQRLH